VKPQSLGTPRFDFDTVTSTNDFAREGIQKGMPEGALYTSRHQTKGRGRRGASWLDSKGASALMSFVLYPTFAVSEAWVLSFAAALAVCEAVQGIGAGALIKWPNDIVVQGGKLAGVLVETACAGERGYGAVVGIGINVAQAGFPCRDDFALAPISLAMVLGASAPGTETVIQAVSQRLGRRYAECAGAETRTRLLSAWRERLVIGESQSGLCLETNRRVRGILRDVRLTDGAALLEEPDGTFTLARPVETPGEESI
jgi:BirA family biotin operon repressor/biotin-[acetyl-CoA-carboxylase] ligase